MRLVKPPNPDYTNTSGVYPHCPYRDWKRMLTVNCVTAVTVTGAAGYGYPFICFVG
jgi:hypothetical protein